MSSLRLSNVIETLAGEPQGSFVDLLDFNGATLGACDITGVSPVWEMHPDTDELFYIVEGEFEITLLEQEESFHHVLTAGEIFVVPKGIWHKPAAPKGAKFIFHTPGISLHSDDADPRASVGTAD